MGIKCCLRPKAKTLKAEACGCCQNTRVFVRQLTPQSGHFSELEPQNVDEMHHDSGSVGKVHEQSAIFTNYE